MTLQGSFAGRYQYGALPHAGSYLGDWLCRSSGDLYVAAAGFATSIVADKPNVKCSSILASAYETWGTSLSRHLLGQYCGVVIDRRRGQALLVQDSLGTRSLYYAITEGELVFADHLGDVVGMLGHRNLDLEYIADYLAHGCSCTSLTPFVGVRRLIFGTSIRVGRTIEFERPWQPSNSVGTEEMTEQERALTLPQLLISALSPLQQHSHPLWCDVSGGLDSTTVYFTARHAGLTVEPFSVVSQTGDDDGDTKFLNALFASDDPSWHRIAVEDAAPFATLPEAASYEPGGEIGYGMRRRFDALRSKRGGDVVLSGMGGDQVFGSVDCAPMSMVDSLYLLEWKRLWHLLSVWTQQHAEQRPLSFWLIQYAIRPLFNHLRGRRFGEFKLPAASWISRTFASRFNLRDRADRPLISDHPQPGRRAFWDDIYLTCAVEASSRMYQFAAPHYYPLLSRPLVEFMANVPDEERRGPATDRVLQRRAFQGMVPHSILTRRGKGTGQSIFDRSFRVAEEWHDVLRRSRLVELGVFDGQAWLDALERARHGLFEALPTFCASISIETWLQGEIGQSTL